MAATTEDWPRLLCSFGERKTSTFVQCLPIERDRGYSRETDRRQRRGDVLNWVIEEDTSEPDEWVGGKQQKTGEQQTKGVGGRVRQKCNRTLSKECSNRGGRARGLRVQIYRSRKNINKIYRPTRRSLGCQWNVSVNYILPPPVLSHFPFNCSGDCFFSKPRNKGKWER